MMAERQGGRTLWAPLQPATWPALLLTAGSEGPASLAPGSCQQQLGTGRTVLHKCGMEATAWVKAQEDGRMGG